MPSIREFTGGRPGALFFEGLEDLILVNSRGLALWNFIFEDPHQLTGAYAPEFDFSEV